MIPANKETYYSIEDIAELYNINPWTIRMWVDRFSELDYITDKNGDILFTPHGKKQIGDIRSLAKKRMKIEDVRKHLSANT